MRVLSGVAIALTMVIAPMAGAQQEQDENAQHAPDLEKLIQRLENIGEQRLRDNVSEQEYAEFRDALQDLRDAQRTEQQIAQQPQTPVQPEQPQTPRTPVQPVEDEPATGLDAAFVRNLQTE
ncbi:MAG: hypothetical protein WD873_08670, partial [Candidatus Hydrogenedentales bacterium]